jgi:hypothetical protein
MNINYIFFKRILIACLWLLVFYFLLYLILAVLSKPQEIEINFPTISGISYSPSIEQNISNSSASSNFDYKLIGYRAGTNRASVHVKKNNKTFVVQQGSLLENKYKLTSVNSEFAIFEYGGNTFQLSTNLNLDN